MTDKTEAYAYRMGFDCGRNGPNTENCHFLIFSTQQNTKEWERGKEDAGRPSMTVDNIK